jgi:hypothetical protein
MTPKKLAAVALTLALAGACGGKQTSDPTPSTGGTGALGGTGTGGATGGTGGTGAISSGGTGGSASCVSNGACSPEGDSCTPPGCCQCSYSCIGGKWQIAACPGCLAPTCPTTQPADGAPCDECQHPVGTPCSYGKCAAQATCDGKTWHLIETPCPPPEPCGTDGTCPAGQLCLYPGGLGDPPHCADNPCAQTEPVSCACAGSLCIVGYCANATPQAVYCDCPNC